MKKIGLLILALMLTFTLTFVVSCNNEENDPSTSSSAVNEDGTADVEIPAEGLWADATYRQDTELGQGEKTFTLVAAAEDKTITFTIHTDASTVGEALLALNLVEGETGAYGLYIKKVNGIVADYDVDQTYWAFYINGSYAMTGVDSTNIEDGATYKLSREK